MPDPDDPATGVLFTGMGNTFEGSNCQMRLFELPQGNVYQLHEGNVRLLTLMVSKQVYLWKEISSYYERLITLLLIICAGACGRVEHFLGR